MLRLITSLTSSLIYSISAISSSISCLTKTLTSPLTSPATMPARQVIGYNDRTPTSQQTRQRAALRRQRTRGSVSPTLLAAGGVLAGLVLFGLFARATGSGGEASGQASALPVSVLLAQEGAGYDVARSFVGRVEARRESDIGFELAGLLNAVTVDDGATVAAGDTLAQLDAALLKSRATELRAAVASASARRDLAKSTQARITLALADAAVSQQTMDEADAQLAASIADLAANNATLAGIELQIEKSSLLAPFAGIVAARYADEGQVLAAGTPIIRLLESSLPEARVAITEEASRRLVVGEDYSLIINGFERTGKLRAVLPERESATRGIGAVFTIDDLDAASTLRSGDLVELKINERVAVQSIRLPIVALTESSRGMWAVYVVNEQTAGEGVLDRRQVELLHQAGDDVYVRGTLAAGDRVVSAGLHRLTPQQAVTFSIDNRGTVQ